MNDIYTNVSTNMYTINEKYFTCLRKHTIKENTLSFITLHDLQRYIM